MSVSKWAYTPEKCDGKPCVGECDKCSRRAEDEISIPTTEVESGRFITRPEERISLIEARLTELELLVASEILRSKQ